MKKNYPKGFIGIAIHNNGSTQVPDSMAIPGEAYLNNLLSHLGAAGYPHAGINRNVMYWGDPVDIPAMYTAIKSSNSNTVGLRLTANYQQM